MKNKKRNIAKILAFCMIIGNFSCVSSEQEKYVDAIVTEFSTSRDKNSNITIKTKKNTIILKELPSEKKFSDIMVSLYSEENGSQGQKMFSGKAPFSYDISQIEDGNYYIQLYYLADKGNGKKTYSSYWYKKSGIQIEKENGQVGIVTAVPYKSNINIYKNRASSSRALEYYLQPEQLVDSDNPDIIAKAEEITKGIADDYEKVKAVHDWVSNNIWYDEDALYGRSEDTEYVASDVLKSKKSVCQGYADLCAALLRAEGIPTKVTNGYAMGAGTTGMWTDVIMNSDDSNHAWNEAFVDGRWIVFDSTWDSNNKYEYGEFSEGTGLTAYAYFDPTIEMFSNTHYIMDNEKTLFQALVKEQQENIKKEFYVNNTINIWDNEYWIGDFEYKYELEDASLAKIEENGKIMGISKGETLLSVHITFGDLTTEFSVPIIVKESENGVVTEQNTLETEKDKETQEIIKMLENIRPSVEEVNLVLTDGMENQCQILYYGVDLEKIGDIKWKYQIENGDVATITTNGIVMAEGIGETNLNIYYESYGQQVHRCVPIRVIAPTMKIIAGNKKVKKGKTKQLSVESNFTGELKWKSSNKKIATISSKGKLKAKKKGKVTITANIGEVKTKVRIIVY